MKIIMNESQIETMEQVRCFLRGTGALEMAISSKSECYDWIRRTLIRFEYKALGKADRGDLLRYLRQVSGYSRAQITRLVSQYQETDKIERRCCRTNGFTPQYTTDDIRQLAHIDELHGTLSGQAAKKLSERAYQIYGQVEYENLSTISVSHLYNLRKSFIYRNVRRRCIKKTQPVVRKIGERRKPDPRGKPGYLRIDTVHQGDQDGQKGVYYINVVDEVTQFELVGSVEGISRRFLIPLLEQLMEQFPFRLLGFHSDNGSEYVNYRVVKLLNKLLIEFTKSRSRHCNDNALVESKNGAIIRKQFGYKHIPQKYAPQINHFCQEYLNPYINFHRPCFYPDTFLDKKGKERKRYPYDKMMTPYEKLKSLPDAESYLKEGTTFKDLDDFAGSISDNDAAKELNQARNELFQVIFERENWVA
jgi:hypothetical protein